MKRRLITEECIVKQDIVEQNADCSMEIRTAKRGGKNAAALNARYVPIAIPEHLKEYADELRLLKGIPLTYLLTDVSDLNEESVRFFCLDINWTDALLDGAFSIGRVCAQDALSDKVVLKAAGEDRKYENMPRMRRMHVNHREHVLRTLADGNGQEDYTLVSGFVMRSQLVGRMKGLHLYGYDREGASKDNDDDGTPLPVLRMETIADNVMIALFHGSVYEIMIEEPKTSLRFGVSCVDESGGKITRSMDLRSALDSTDLGKKVGSLCIDGFTDDNGRLYAKQLADAVGAELKKVGKLGAERITPARFAYEMIAVAHRAKLTASDTGVGKERKNG